MLRVQLHGIEQAQHLVEIAACAHRIHEHGFDLPVGSDEEHRAHRRVVHRRARPAARVLVNHVVELRDGQIRVTDQRIVDRVPLRFLDVADPVFMIADRIDAEPDDLRVAPVEFRLEAGHVSQFGSADGREILRVREQDRPFIPDPVVKPDRPFGGFGGEVRGFISYTDGHARPPRCVRVGALWPHERLYTLRIRQPRSSGCLLQQRHVRAVTRGRADVIRCTSRTKRASWSGHGRLTRQDGHPAYRQRSRKPGGSSRSRAAISQTPDRTYPGRMTGV